MAMAADDAWSVYAIARYLTGKGYPVSERTVRRWIDPEYAERDRERNRGRSRSRARAKRGTLTRVRVLDDEALRVRIGVLGGAGLDKYAIAKVLRIDHAVTLRPAEVERYMVGAADDDAACAPPEEPEHALTLPLPFEAAVVQAARLRRNHWSWTAIARVMAEYHGHSKSSESWRYATERAGLDAPKRPMSPARRRALEALHGSRHARASL